MAHDVFTHQSSIWASSRFKLLGEALEWHCGRRFDVGGTLRRWLASPSHREIVLSPTMRRQGAGVTRGRFGGRGATIWVLHVGRLTLPGTQLPDVGFRSRRSAWRGGSGSIGFRAAMRFFEYEAREIVERAGHSGHGFRLRDHRPGGARDRAPDRRPDGDQVPGAHRRPHEGGRREVRRRRGRGGRVREGHPEARDRRPHAARRARGPEGRRQAGVLRRRRLGRPPQAAGDDLLAGRRHRHRAGGRGAAGQGRPPPLLHDRAVQRLHGEGGDRLHGRHRPRAHAHHPHPRPAGAAVRGATT